METVRGSREAKQERERGRNDNNKFSKKLHRARALLNEKILDARLWHFLSVSFEDISSTFLFRIFLQKTVT